MRKIIELDISMYKGVQTQSDLIRPGDIFVCIKGFIKDGHDFANNALKNGATLIISQRKISGIDSIVCKNTRKAAAIIADKVFDDPSSKLEIVGITGTNGKSSVCFTAEKILRKSGYKVGAIGTGKYIIDGRKFFISHTTPDIIELRKILVKMLENGIKMVIMEVSSHAISLERVYGIKFSIACFTNLSQDHLDFHKSIDEYAKVKLGFIESSLKSGGKAIVNIDDNYGKKLKTNDIESISLHDNTASYFINNIECSLNSTTFCINKKKMQSSLLSKVNIYNLSFVYAIIKNLIGKVDPKLFQSAKAIRGRFTLIKDNIIVDYAHSPDSMKNILTFAKKLKKKRIITIFGCGGDRDKQKREVMGKIACKYSDFSIITSDNSRNEDPNRIIRDIVLGFEKDNYYILRDRGRAIDYGRSLLKKDELLLVLGKGSEKYIIEGGKKIPFSDIDYIESTNKKFKKDFDLLFLEILFGIKEVQRRFKKSVSLRHISTSSIDILPNTLFFALKGEKYDGNEFVEEVLKQKNCFAIVNKHCKISDDRCIVVKNVLKSYQKLAYAYKNCFRINSVGITGSVGKTTTKEFVYNVLEEQGKSLKTNLNENNQIGVAKTLFRLTPEYQNLIVELGSNHKGEIDSIAKILRARVAIITNIGKSHLEFFKNEAGVFEEKSKIYNYCKYKLSPKGEFFDKLDTVKVEPKILKQKDNKIYFELDKDEFYISLQPTFRVEAASFAISTGKFFGISKKQIQKGLLKSLELPMRMQIEKIGGVEFLFDCYNASPKSMSKAIKFWKTYKAQKTHFAILGDMLELGERSVVYHKNIGRELKKNLFYTVGEKAKYYLGKKHFHKIEDFLETNFKFERGSIVLLKASKGINFQKLVKNIRGRK